MPNTVFYGFQFAHHGNHTAFFALKKVLEKANIRVVSALRPRIFWMRGWRRLLPFWMQIQECRIHRFFKNDSTKVVHYFFPENTLFNAPRWKGSKKLVMTCHQPVNEGFFDRVGKKGKYFLNGVKNADVIILMASNDIHFYQKIAPKAKVICIPHGVDTSFFSRKNMPCDIQKKHEIKQILTVGNWLRDYRFWAEVAKEILRTRKDIEFAVVAGAEAQEEIKTSFNNSVPSKIKMLSGISDEELRDVYATSDLLFLPLIDAWANNALLEASSMGVPVMATDLPAVREYLSDDLAICFKNDSAKAVAEQIQVVLRDEEGLLQKGRALRERMEYKFSWGKIAERHMEIYRMLDSTDWARNFN